MGLTSTRVHLKTLGCRLNEAELETWSRQFRARGWTLATRPEQADLVVVNTCAVTAEAARKSRQLVRRSQRANPQAKLVLSGCYATLDAERAQADLRVDLLIDNADKAALVELVAAEFALPSMPVQAITSDGETLFRAGRQRAFIKVQDGCRYRCSYCIVTLARGDESSRPIAEITAEVNALHRSGVLEIVLAGVHLGGYGSDRGEDLATLVRALLAETAIPRIRIGSLEPWDLPNGFLHLFGDPRLQPHLHLPMQSGSDAVLRRMSRRCRAGEFRALVSAARAQVPDINITTDLIVGFPGESDAEWRETLAFTESMRFGHIHIFNFSPRTGTKAAELPNPVPREIKRARCRQLHEIAERHKREFAAAFVGRCMPVLLESRQSADKRRNIWAGYTPNYLSIRINASATSAVEGTLSDVMIVGIDADDGQLLGATGAAPRALPARSPTTATPDFE